ncbi:MAG: hypothetical protein AB8I08_25060 [Sandaracinaceae bacterium]
MPQRSQTDREALRHPLWLGGLLLLLVNDHALKGAGLIDSAWTGKLSDVAGMLVAPVLVGVMLQSRAPGRVSNLQRRAVAFVLVGGWFTLANLVPASSDLTAQAGALFGLEWHFVSDPTDLVALGVLPLAWHVASHRGPARTVFSRDALKAWAERGAVGFGVAACVASPNPEPSWRTAAYMVNDTGEPVEVRLRWVDVAMDCQEVARRPAEMLPRSAFEPGVRFMVGVNETLPITRARDDGFPGPGPGFEPDSGVPATISSLERVNGSCDAVILSVDGLEEDQLIFWDGLGEQAVPFVIEDAAERRRQDAALILLRTEEDDPESLSLIGPLYQLDVPNDRYEGGAACRDYGSITGFDWSGLPFESATTPQRIRLTEVRPTVDGCVSISFEYAFADRFGGELTEESSGFICVPPEDFPFQANAVVSVAQDARSLRITQANVLDDGTAWRVGELFIVRGAGSLSEGPFNLQLMTADDACEGVRMECGGFRLPTPGTLQLGDGTRFVHPGDVVERTQPSGRQARLRVGRAETIHTTRAACGAGRDQLGARLEALVVYGEDPR